MQAIDFIDEIRPAKPPNVLARLLDSAANQATSDSLDTERSAARAETQAVTSL